MKNVYTYKNTDIYAPEPLSIFPVDIPTKSPGSVKIFPPRATFCQLGNNRRRGKILIPAS